MMYLTDPGIWAAVGVFIVAMVVMLSLIRHDQDIAEREAREILREQIADDNAILDAMWRQQLDREQLFRDYVRGGDDV